VIVGPEISAAPQIERYVRDGVPRDTAVPRAAVDLRAAGTQAAKETLQRFLVNLSFSWFFWYSVGLSAGGSVRSATAVLAAIAVGEAIHTVAFGVEYGTLAISGIHNDGLSVGTVARLVGAGVPEWAPPSI
jgi:hypothetical protein